MADLIVAKTESGYQSINVDNVKMINTKIDGTYVVIFLTSHKYVYSEDEFPEMHAAITRYLELENKLWTESTEEEEPYIDTSKLHHQHPDWTPF